MQLTVLQSARGTVNFVSRANPPAGCVVCRFTKQCDPDQRRGNPNFDHHFRRGSVGVLKDYRSIVCSRKPVLPKLAERERKKPAEAQRDAPRDTSRTTAQVGRRSAAPCPANCYGSRRGLGCGSRHVLGNARSVSVAWLCSSCPGAVGD